jgi:tRNA threonylcarbamoyl adenosine modification protein YeaZ
MRNILALESSSDFASLALWRDGLVAGSREFASKRSLSADLFPALDQLLEGSEPVDRIVVGLGPGSYAGVRIAIAAALGLQSVWGCELVGIASVVAMGEPGETFQVIGDARRGTWYYSQVVSGECQTGPVLLESREELMAAVASGSGAVRSSEILPEALGAEFRAPRAAVLAELAAKNSGIIQHGSLEPLYLREPHITKPGGGSLV